MPARTSIPAADIVSARVERLEAELARVRDERAQEADDLAAMLVRIAEAERERAAAEGRAAELVGRLREVEALAERALRPPPPPTEDPRVAQLQGALEEAQSRTAALTAALDESETASHARVGELEARLGEAVGVLDATKRELAQARTAADIGASRAALAERSAADGAQALERAHAELAADRTRVVDMEAKLARVRREHGEAMEGARRELEEAVESLRRAHAEAMSADARTRSEEAELAARAHAGQVTALRAEHASMLDAAHKDHEEKHARALAAAREELAAAKRTWARALEEERSATARARQQVGLLDAGLSASRERAGRARQQLEELARREEAAASQLAATIQEALRSLSIGGEPQRAVSPPSGQARTPAPPAGSLDELEIDLGD
jgi:chromosome segregation ATPase